MRTVRQIMNPTLASLQADDLAVFALSYLSNVGIHAAPVLDTNGRPVGMLSRSDLLGDLAMDRVKTRMRDPAVSIHVDYTLNEAARAFGDSGLHHLVVVDDRGVAVGALSAIDLIRAQIGRSTPHPPACGAWTGDPSMVWSEPDWLTRQGLEQAPYIPGYVAVVYPGEAGMDRVLWAQAAENIRTSLSRFHADPPGYVRPFLHAGPLQYRFAVPTANTGDS